MFRWLLLAFFLVAVVAGLVIGVLNPQAVTLDLALFSLNLPLGALMLSALVLGVLFGLLLTVVLFVLPGRLAGRRRSKTSAAGQQLTDQSNA
jgi:lipopolysaccharide assembly protein A